MSGHNKWSTIKNKKAKTDAQKGKIFTKIGRELTVAVKSGGADPEANANLKNLIVKARENNMPNENIKRVIDKASGTGDNVNYEEFVYEGYGPAGVAVILDIMTDNKNRTAGEIRHIFAKTGGNLGETGCVGWMFDTKGVLTIEVGKNTNLEEIELAAIEAGADDVQAEDDIIEVACPLEIFEEVKKYFKENGINYQHAEIDKVPQTNVEITDLDVAKQVMRMMDLLEDHDDVQNVYANFDIPSELAEQL
ncbi:MAG: YebC/PmpR family DNA-binding transcriptional regulator [Clostridia bacterium]